MTDVVTRERMVVAALRHNPNLMEPIDALAAVVWPIREDIWEDIRNPWSMEKQRAAPCRTCNGPIDEYTIGCTTCRQRKYMRQRRAA